MRAPASSASSSARNLPTFSARNLPIWLLNILLPLLAFVGLTGCSYLDGYATSNYLSSVSKIQYSSDSALLSLNSNLADLSGDPGKVKSAVDRLTSDKDQVDKTLSELKEADAPSEAKTLKEDLLELYSQGSGLLGDLIQTGKYTLAEQPLIARYEAAGTSFTSSVKGAKDAASLSTCLNSYMDNVNAIDKKAEDLDTPTLSRRSNMRFVFDLKTLSGGLSDMIASLKSGNQDAIKVASDQLAAAGDSSASAKQAEANDRAADAADYNLKIMHLNQLMARIGQDEAALHKEFDRS